MALADGKYSLVWRNAHDRGHAMAEVGGGYITFPAPATNHPYTVYAQAHDEMYELIVEADDLCVGPAIVASRSVSVTVNTPEGSPIGDATVLGCSAAAATDDDGGAVLREALLDCEYVVSCGKAKRIDHPSRWALVVEAPILHRKVRRSYELYLETDAAIHDYHAQPPGEFRDLLLISARTRLELVRKGLEAKYRELPGCEPRPWLR